MAKQITGSNNATITLNYASTKDVEELIQFLASKAEGLDLGGLIDCMTDLSSLFSQDFKTIVPLLQQVIGKLEGDDYFTEIIYKLLQPCQYNQIPITRQLFDDKPEIREDYYLLKWEVVKFNLTPFWKGLSGKLFHRQLT